MTNWEVVVMRQKLEPGVHVEFYESDCTGHAVIPPLSPKDSLNVRFANDHQGGAVVAARDDQAVIEVSGARWKIRLATSAERHYRRPRGMMTEEWIVEGGLT
jgi:hypothetical protein